MEDDEEVRDKNNSGTGPECGKENAAAAAVAFPEKFESEAAYAAAAAVGGVPEPEDYASEAGDVPK